jgi:aminoglycoside phosphotransferase (APT) family kinase protein
LKFDVSSQMSGGLKLSDQIVAPNTRDLEVLAKTLSAWLAKQMPAASTIRIDNLDYPRGAGMSHETILFDAHWHESGRDHTQGMVVRIKPQVFTVFPDNLFEEQYQLMKMLGVGNHVRVARVLWLEHDATILGNPFFIMEKKYGRVPVSYPPYATSGWLAAATPAQRRKVWEGAVRQLAAIQLVPISQARFLEGPAHAREGLAQEWDKYVRFVTWVQEAEPKPILQAALDRLQAQWPSNQPDGIVWGDARIGNMMFDDQFDVVAVMDCRISPGSSPCQKPCTDAMPSKARGWREWARARRRLRCGKKFAARAPQTSNGMRISPSSRWPALGCALVSCVVPQ